MPKGSKRPKTRKATIGTKKNPVGASGTTNIWTNGIRTQRNTRTKANKPGSPSSTALHASGIQGRYPAKSSKPMGFKRSGIIKGTTVNTTPKNPGGKFPRPTRRKKKK